MFWQSKDPKLERELDHANTALTDSTQKRLVLSVYTLSEKRGLTKEELNVLFATIQHLAESLQKEPNKRLWFDEMTGKMLVMRDKMLKLINVEY